MADNLVLASVMDFSKLKVPDLKKELKNRGLSTNGNKNELIERLQASLNSSEKASNESVDDLEEDLLNEDDEEMPLDTTESVISDIDNLSDNLLKKSVKRKSEESTNGDTKATPPLKRVILNRNNPIIVDKRISTDSKEDTDKTNGTEEKKVIKLSNVSVKERLEMRAKKFAVPVSADAKKLARAERFGLPVKTTSVSGVSSSSSNNKIDTKVSTNIDVLKQRAERFGGSVSKVMSSLESQEKLERRKARFGIVSETDKAKQRLERFKQPVK